jgi:hypothetical protein
MSGIWRSPALKPKSATRSGPRITTSTPNIILGRFPRTEKERKTLCRDCRQIRRSNFPTSAASETLRTQWLSWSWHRASSANFKRASLSTSIVSGGDYMLSEEDSGPHTPAVRAFKLVDRKVAASWMLLDNSELYWLAASRAGIIHKKVKRHGGAYGGERPNYLRAKISEMTS